MSHRSSFRFVWLIVILSVALVGCGGAAPTPTSIAAPTVAPLPTAKALPLSTQPSPPTPTLVLPTPSPTTGVKTTPTRAAAVPAGSMRVKIFMIAQNDAGRLGKKIGCDDSVVAVERIIPTTNAVLRASLNELLSVHEQNYGESGLYNALYQSTLKLDDVSLVAGRATIYLSGKVVVGGTCDNPRVDAQIKETALQFSTVKQVSILVNKIPLEQILSGKGN
jgi:spore germination protein GerM